jgi:hypothetical protein
VASKKGNQEMSIEKATKFRVRLTYFFASVFVMTLVLPFTVSCGLMYEDCDKTKGGDRIRCNLSNDMVKRKRKEMSCGLID